MYNTCIDYKMNIIYINKIKKAKTIYMKYNLLDLFKYFSDFCWGLVCIFKHDTKYLINMMLSKYK